LEPGFSFSLVASMLAMKNFRFLLVQGRLVVDVMERPRPPPQNGYGLWRKDSLWNRSAAGFGTQHCVPSLQRSRIFGSELLGTFQDGSSNAAIPKKNISTDAIRAVKEANRAGVLYASTSDSCPMRKRACQSIQPVKPSWSCSRFDYPAAAPAAFICLAASSSCLD
jgi:hypothetical protein